MSEQRKNLTPIERRQRFRDLLTGALPVIDFRPLAVRTGSPLQPNRRVPVVQINTAPSGGARPDVADLARVLALEPAFPETQWAVLQMNTGQWLLVLTVTYRTPVECTFKLVFVEEEDRRGLEDAAETGILAFTTEPLAAEEPPDAALMRLTWFPVGEHLADALVAIDQQRGRNN